MTIEELNKIIQEEFKAYLNEEQTDEAYMEDGDDDIEVTTDEPEEGGEDEALDTLRQIYDMLKDYFEGDNAAGAEEPLGDVDGDGDVDGADAAAKADDKDDDDAEALQERFKKLANIIKG